MQPIITQKCYLRFTLDAEDLSCPSLRKYRVLTGYFWIAQKTASNVKRPFVRLLLFTMISVMCSKATFLVTALPWVTRNLIILIT